jgi:hypothetical protein
VGRGRASAGRELGRYGVGGGFSLLRIPVSRSVGVGVGLGLGLGLAVGVGLGAGGGCRTGRNTGFTPVDTTGGAGEGVPGSVGELGAWGVPAAVRVGAFGGMLGVPGVLGTGAGVFEGAGVPSAIATTLRPTATMDPESMGVMEVVGSAGLSLGVDGSPARRIAPGTFWAGPGALPKPRSAPARKSAAAARAAAASFIRVPLCAADFAIAGFARQGRRPRWSPSCSDAA